jgi:hypothetical protein
MRWFRSTWLIVPATFLSVVAAVQPQSAANTDEAAVRALVKSIYARYNRPIPEMGPLPSYSPSTAAMYEQYNVLTKDEELSELSGFDHYCECQDFDEKASRLLGVTLVRVSPDLIDATARYVLFSDHKPGSTRIRFQKTGTWKIHDVFWTESGGSLRGSLTETIAEHAIAKSGAGQNSAVPQSSATQKPPPAPVIPVQAISLCGDNPGCAEVSTFVATVTDLRESVMQPGSAPLRVVDVTVRFSNKTQGAVVLGYVAGSGVVTDDRGNRYSLGTYGGSGVRGIGVLANGVIDPKFALRPGETGDARFEFLWASPPRNAIFGTRLVVELAVRELESLPGDQWRLGREYALQFRNFGGSGVSPATSVAATPPPASPVTSSVDAACAKRPECYSAGTFLAEITRLTTSVGPARSHDIQFSVRFRNLTGQPLALGHTPQSVSVVDDQGNRYAPRWNDITEVRGMGRASGMQSDPSFILRPGATGEATYQARFAPPNGEVRYGTTYTVEFAVEELELLPGNQVRSARQFAVGFHDVKTNMGGWRALGGLINIQIKK